MRCLFSHLQFKILTCRTVDLFAWSRSIHMFQSENGKYNLQSNADVYKQFLLHRIITRTNWRLLIIKQVGKEKYIPSVTCSRRNMLKAAPDFLSHDLGSISYRIGRTLISELKNKLSKETKIWVTIYNPKPAITDGLFVYELRLTKTFQAKTHLASDKFEPTARSWTTRGVFLFRAWNKSQQTVAHWQWDHHGAVQPVLQKEQILFPVTKLLMT